MPTPPIADTDRQPQAPQRRVHGATKAVALAASATVIAAAAFGRWLDDGAVVVRAAALVIAGGSVLLWLAARHLPRRAFGAANSVTLARAALAVLLVALLGAAPTPALGWALVGVGAAGVALDGVDGALARKRSESSEFGARFDMETDALLILVLAALVWQHGKAGAWVLAAGLLRYAFVTASYALPWLGTALPPSRRRQAVCVVQIVSLLAALAPVVVAPWSGMIALAGVAALAWSFGVDVLLLARRAHGRRT